MGLRLNDLCAQECCGGVLIKVGWCFYDPKLACCMSALAEIQRSLNTIRAIERDSSAEVRLAALAFLTATSSDIAKELRRAEQVPQPKQAKPKMPQVPKPNLPKKQPQQPVRSEPRPFTEPQR